MRVASSYALALVTPTRRRFVLLGVAGVVCVAGGLAWKSATRFPPDTTPEGAYLRIASAIGDDRSRDVFAYLEDRAQHACWSIRDYRRSSSERVARSYPEPERTRLLDLYRPHASAEDGSDVFVDLAKKKGFFARLRKDLSGVAHVEVNGERATIETARGTRYAFRKRENGIWGLTMFTAELDEEAERAARDDDVVKNAAEDYERGK